MATTTTTGLKPGQVLHTDEGDLLVLTAARSGGPHGRWVFDACVLGTTDIQEHHAQPDFDWELKELGGAGGETRNVSDVAGDIRLAVTRSAGEDRAVVVFIDTEFEPDASDGGTGLRVLINDDEAYVGMAYDFGRHHEAEAVHFEVRLADIPYTGKELT